MDKIVKSYADDLLNDQLGYQVSEAEEKACYAFCRQANSDFLIRSLKELKGFAKSAQKMKIKGQETPPILEKLTRIYFRKVEEQARLFTALGMFGTSYRTHLATWMEHYYGLKKWWDPIYTTILAGDHCTSVKKINGTPITSGLANAVDRLLRGIDGYDLSGNKIKQQNSGHFLLNFSKLSDLEELIKEQWPQFKISLQGHNPALTTQVSFLAVFKRIRDARNSCFHHREVASRPDIMRNIENMLDLVNVHLETASISARIAAVKPIASIVQWDERHNFGLNRLSPYTIEISIENEKSISVMNGRTTFEAMQRAIDVIAADDRMRITAVSIGAMEAISDFSTTLRDVENGKLID